MPRYNKVIAENRKARFDYHILETFEAGIALKGAEVKSVRAGRVNLRDSFARAQGSEIWVHGIHISHYEFSRDTSLEPLRTRKLLMKKQEIRKLIAKSAGTGVSLIPLKIYFTGDWAKLEIAVAKGKKTFDKKEVLKKKDIERETERELSGKE